MTLYCAQQGYVSKVDQIWKNDKIKNLLKNYVIVKRIDNFSRWEHTKTGNLLLYKKIKINLNN